MDAVAAVIAHEELSASDPGFWLAYLAHAMLFINNFCRSANADQREQYLAKVISGEWVGGMCMTEPMNTSSNIYGGMPNCLKLEAARSTPIKRILLRI